MPPTLQAPVKFGDLAQLQLYSFVSFQQIMIRRGVFTNFKALFFNRGNGFLLAGPSQMWKKPWNRTTGLHVYHTFQ